MNQSSAYWHAQVLVETDIFSLQCTDRVSLDGL